MFQSYRSVFFVPFYTDRKSIRFLGEEWKEGTLTNVEIEEKIMRSWDVSHVEDNLDSWSIWLEFLKGTFWVIKWNTFFGRDQT